MRDTLLREKWWSFAAANISPAADPKESIGPMKTRFVLPENCLRIRFLSDDTGALFYDDMGRWDVEAAQVLDGDPPKAGMVLVTDVRSPKVTYTRRIEAVREWDPSFITAFAYELASMMGRRLGKSRTLGDDLHARAVDALAGAAQIELQGTLASNDDAHAVGDPGASRLALAGRLVAMGLANGGGSSSRSRNLRRR